MERVKGFKNKIYEEKEAILFICGIGGHEEQMKRLVSGFSSNLENQFKFVYLVESNYKYQIAKDVLTNQEMRNKYSIFFSIVFFPKFLLDLFINIFKILFKYNVRFIISTGPGLAIPFCYFFKYFNDSKIIFIETWSRFYSRSSTGNLMYKISDVFFIQSETLKSVYPNAHFSGRL